MKYTVKADDFEYTFYALKKEEAVGKFIKAVDLTWNDNAGLHIGSIQQLMNNSPTTGIVSTSPISGYTLTGTGIGIGTTGNTLQDTP
jgi:hypothetical protein